MLGHTILVFSDKDFTITSAQAVSYGAYLESENPLLIAIKGLIGLLHGVYRCSPFYDYLKENRIQQHRDLWAYELQVDRAGIDRMIDFIDRQLAVTGRYSFTTDNCSSLLLPVAGAAQGLHGKWIEFPRLYVVPLEVPRWGYENGLVSNVVFFPSQLKALRSTGAELSQDARLDVVRTVQTFADGRVDGTHGMNCFTGAAQRLTIDYAEFLRDHWQMDANAYRRLLLECMPMNAGCSAESTRNGLVPDILERTPPAKVSAGLVLRTAGRDGDGGMRGVLSIRPASHSLLDPRDDLAGNSTVKTLALSMEYTLHAMYLRDFRLLEIESLPIRDEFYQPLSWRFNMGYGGDKYRAVIGDNGAGDTDLGIGVTKSFCGSGIGYVMLDGRAGLAEEFTADYALGAGISLGTVWQWGKRCRAVVEVSETRFEVGDTSSLSEAKVEGSLRTGKCSSVEILVRMQSGVDSHVSELIWRINCFF